MLYPRAGSFRDSWLVRLSFLTLLVGGGCDHESDFVVEIRLSRATADSILDYAESVGVDTSTTPVSVYANFDNELVGPAIALCRRAGRTHAATLDLRYYAIVDHAPVEATVGEGWHDLSLDDDAGLTATIVGRNEIPSWARQYHDDDRYGACGPIRAVSANVYGERSFGCVDEEPGAATVGPAPRLAQTQPLDLEPSCGSVGSEPTPVEAHVIDLSSGYEELPVE